MNTDIPCEEGGAAESDISYRCCCVICGKIIEDGRYGCDCREKEWTDEYRVTDVKYEWTEGDIRKALAAFRRYSTKSGRGMLQYNVMPHRRYSKRLKLRVGNTPLFELPRLGAKYGIDLFVKDEGKNPGGSFKDRETVVAALHTMAAGRKRAIIYSSGNAAASAALVASHLQIDLITCVSGDTYEGKVDYIRNLGSDVILIGDENTNYEEGYRLFSQLAKENFFARRGVDNWSVRNPFRVTGDKTTALEVVKQYGALSGARVAVPDYVVVPTGNGSCLAGMWKGFVELHRIGAITRVPKMVSAAIKNASPVYQAFHASTPFGPEVCDLDEVSEDDMAIGSVIVAEEGYDSIMATDALRESEGTAVVVSHEDIRRALLNVLETAWPTTRRHRFIPEPAALVALAVVEKVIGSADFESDEKPSVVAVMTGHGSKAKDQLFELLGDRDDLRHRVEELVSGHEVPHGEGDAPPGELIAVEADKELLENTLAERYKQPAHAHV